MVHLVQGSDAVEGWRRGCDLLLQTPGRMVSNLITEIQRPTEIEDSWYDRFDPKSVGAPDRMSVVAKVLFPDLPRQQGEARDAYYNRCARMLQRGLRTRRLRSSWGSTYFQRLVSLDGSDNQIERAIRALCDWQVRSETAITAHLSSPKLDGLRKRGSPFS